MTKANKNGNQEVPACGLIIGGELIGLVDKGFKKIHCIYNLSDDPDIGKKYFDASVLTAWFRPESNVRIHSVLISGGIRKPPSLYNEDEWSLADLRSKQPNTNSYITRG